ncbi:hypothetical protein HDU98_010040 [Podochytrium sp. JEL0797]|nr:hypothetical protein HDU98_010040 [Podochytrium sp. JEL0797]
MPPYGMNGGPSPPMIGIGLGPSTSSLLQQLQQQQQQLLQKKQRQQQQQQHQHQQQQQLSFQDGPGGPNPMQHANGGSFPSQEQLHRNPPSDIIVFEHIHLEECTLDTVNKYFEQFGTITGIQMQKDAKRVAVRYASIGKAKNAYACHKVIFGNRGLGSQPAGVRIAGAGATRPEGSGAVGAPMQQASLALMRPPHTHFSET